MQLVNKWHAQIRQRDMNKWFFFSLRRNWIKHFFWSLGWKWFLSYVVYVLSHMHILLLCGCHECDWWKKLNSIIFFSSIVHFKWWEAIHNDVVCTTHSALVSMISIFFPSAVDNKAIDVNRISGCMKNFLHGNQICNNYRSIQFFLRITIRNGRLPK